MQEFRSEQTNFMPVRQQKKKSKRLRRLPPGQRLILYGALASTCILGFSFMLPPGHADLPYEQAELPQPHISEQVVLRQSEIATDLLPYIQTLTNQKKLHAGIFALDTKSGKFIDIDAARAFPAASTIKLPVLVKVLDEIDRGNIDPKTILEIRPELIGGGSGTFQWRPAGSKVTLQETLENMIIISDNTATNLLIDLLGGADICNKTFAEWGLDNTRIRNWLPDLEGTNTTSPKDLAKTIAMVNQQKLLSKESRDTFFSIMERTKTRTLLPQGLPPTARIAHKTGDIGKVVGDAGLVTTDDGAQYLIAMLVERPHNDRRANEMIRQASRLVYTGFTEPERLSTVSTANSVQQAQPPRKRQRRHR